MNLLYNKHIGESNLYIFFITIFGFLLRLININKPEGLWNDEYVSWFVSATPFNEGFWQEVLKQCHMPLYYLYLKPFAGCGDLILRLTSVIPSVAAIPVMYLAGKEYSEKTGRIAAIITSVLSFFVYYSQEVRFYSLLFLFSAFSLLFTIRLIKRGKGLIGYIVSNVLILLTHVLGGIYVLFNLCYIVYKKKKISKCVIAAGAVLLAILIPLGTNILGMLPSSQWWGRFSYTNILFLFSDYLSPILTNNINAPGVFFYTKNPVVISLMTIPTLLGLYAVFQGAKKAKGFAITALCTILALSLLALSGKIVFITKYSIEILPIIILLFALGINGKSGKILITVFIGLHLLAIMTPYYPAKIFRSEGHKLAADILNSANSDKIILTYYEPERFLRYLNTNAEMLYISKINRFEYLENPKEIFNSVKKGEKISVVFLDSVSFIPENRIEEAKIRNLPEMFVSFSIIKNSLIRELDKNYGSFDVQTKGSWTIISAKKVK